MGQRVRKSFFGGRGIAQADARPWVSRGLSNLVSRTLPIRGRYTEAEVLQAIISAPTTWAAVPTASSPPSISYGAASNDTPDGTKLGGVSWKRYWFRGDNGQIEGAGGGRTLVQRADFESSQVQGPVFGGGVNYNNNSGNSTEWWVNYQGLLRSGQDTGDIGDFSPWGWGFTLTGRGFAFNGQSFTDFAVYVEEGGVLKRCPYQSFPRGDVYAYVDFGTSATRNVLLLIEPDSWSSEILIPTTSTMTPWSGWRANKLTFAFMGDSYLQSMNATDGCAFSEQLAVLAGGHPATHVSAQGGTGYSSDNQDSSLRPFQFAHRLNRLSAPQPDVIDFRGGINDGWPTSLVVGGGTSDTAQAIDRALQTARFDNPSALLVVGSPWAPNGPAGQTVGGKYQLLNNYLQTALARDPGPWIFIDSLNGTWKTSKGTQRATAEGPWITGTGNTGAPNGSGNADIYITDDGTHFSDPGRRYGAQKNSQYMHEAAASMVLSLASAAQVLAGVTQSATATAVVSAALSASAAQVLDGVSQGASTSAPAVAMAAQALSPVSTSAAASAQAGATAAQALAGVGQSAAAAAQDRLSAAQALQGVGQAAAGVSLAAAAAAQTLAGVAQAAAAGSASVASASQALAPVGQASNAASVAGASSARVLAGVSQTAAGVGVPGAVASQQLQGASQTASASAVPSGIVATQNLAAVSQSAAAAARASAAAAQSVVAAVNSAAAAALEAVQGAQQLAGVTQTASAAKAAQVAAAQVLEAVGQVAEAQRFDVRAVSGAQALANVVQLAVLQPGGAPAPVYGAIPAGRQRSYPSRQPAVSARRPANVQGRSW